MKVRQSLGIAVGALALIASIFGGSMSSYAATSHDGSTSTVTYSFQSINFPGSVFTQLLGINATKVIAGYHGDGVHHPNKGFILTLPNSFASDNFPNSTQTQAIAINDAEHTGGFYIDTAGTTHGFLNQGGQTGVWQTVDYPGTTFNQILGRNNVRQAVGYYQDSAGHFHAYIYYEASHTFVLLPYFNAQATGINDNGVVCGFKMPTSTTSVGFIRANGQTANLQFPGSSFTQALGINNAGEVVGSYNDSVGKTHGFLYNNGTYTAINVPNATSTVVNGINVNGDIVGFYTATNGNTVGFVGTPS